MGSLIAETFDGLARVTGLAADNTPYVPSAPVQIGTSGPRRGVPEAGSWQALIVMFGFVIIIGGAVLMYAVRQRAGLLERRRVRRMAAAVALMGEGGGPAEGPAEAMADAATTPASPAPPPAPPPVPPPAPSPAPPATQSRPSPNA